jgi:lipopolysaccharide transport system permease protein
MRRSRGTSLPAESIIAYDSAVSPMAPGRAFRALWARRELVLTLARRDVRARYQQSILGIYWTAINPLATAAVYTVVFSFIARVPVGSPPYAVFVLSGLVPWSFFSNALVNATSSLVGMAGLLTKIAFPREILPLAAILARLVDLVASLAVLLLVMAWFGLPPRWTMLLLPIPIVIELAFLVGLGLILSAANLFYRDVGQLLSVLLSLWIFLTPVVYPLDLVPTSLRLWIALNPLTPVVVACRALIVEGQVPDFGSLGGSAAISFLFLVVGYALFKWLEPVFAETV